MFYRLNDLTMCQYAHHCGRFTAFLSTMLREGKKVDFCNEIVAKANEQRRLFDAVLKANFDEGGGGPVAGIDFEFGKIVFNVLETSQYLNLINQEINEGAGDEQVKEVLTKLNRAQWDNLQSYMREVANPS